MSSPVVPLKQLQLPKLEPRTLISLFHAMQMTSTVCESSCRPRWRASRPTDVLAKYVNYIAELATAIITPHLSSWHRKLLNHGRVENQED